jgi:polyphosphate kinase
MSLDAEDTFTDRETAEIYYRELVLLQTELVKLQLWIRKTGKRLVIFFEGRDAAGKGGAIARFTRFLNPRHTRIVALPRPTEMETTQWYFQRHIKHFPHGGEIVFFDRSWYNRAVVEPVMGFCSEEQYQLFLKQVVSVEKLLTEDGIDLVKFWFSIAREVQHERFENRRRSLLTSWKFSTVDLQAQMKWDDYTIHKQRMFTATGSEHCPWIVVDGNNKENARLEAMRYVLSLFDYDGKAEAEKRVVPDPEIVSRLS